MPTVLLVPTLSIYISDLSVAKLQSLTPVVGGLLTVTTSLRLVQHCHHVELPADSGGFAADHRHGA